MSFRRRRSQNALRPIHSIKNIVQNVTIIAAAATELSVVLQTVDTAALATTTEVERGARVNTVYIEAWLYGNAVAGVNSPISWFLAKNPGNNLTLPTPATAGTNDNKRWIFAQGKGLVGASANGQPGYLIRGWFRIPPRMRRMGSDDRIILSVQNQTANDVNFCKLFIYKWYT